MTLAPAIGKKIPGTDWRLSGYVFALLEATMAILFRVIDGTLFKGERGGVTRLRAVETATGHTEFSAYSPVIWNECGPLGPVALFNMKECAERDALEEIDGEKQKELSARKSAQRAKRNVRHSCKSFGADTLLTLTYKANVTALDQCKADLKEFVRRLRRVWPEFVAVAGFEQQKRGAWHVHLATLAFPQTFKSGVVVVKSFNVIRSIWRNVTKHNGGNIDVASRKRNSKRSPARIAAYLSKYITKAFEDGQKWSNRWTKFGNIAAVRKCNLGEWATLREAIAAAYELIGDGQSIVTTFVSTFKDSFYMALEPKQGARNASVRS